MSLPDEAGGAGLSVADEALAFREYGRALLSPSLISTVLAARVAHHVGDANLLEQIREGRSRAALAVPLGGKLDASAHGELHVFDGDECDLVVAWDRYGAALFDVAQFTTGACRAPQPITGLDPSVTLALASPSDAPARFYVSAGAEPLPSWGRLLTASMLVGIAEAARDMSVEHAKTRQQFGVPIGTFQAIKHRCADMALNAEAAWSQTCYAALCLRERLAEAEFQVAAAKLIAANAALSATAENIQVHGAMGFTAELGAHLLLKRAHLLNQVGTSARALSAEILTYPAPA